MNTTVMVTKDTVAKLRLAAGSMPLGQYLGKLADGIRLPVQPTLPADAMQWSTADLKAVVTSKLDQMHAEIMTVLERLADRVEYHTDWLNGQISLLRDVAELVRPGYASYMREHAEEWAIKVAEARLAQERARNTAADKDGDG